MIFIILLLLTTLFIILIMKTGKSTQKGASMFTKNIYILLAIFSISNIAYAMDYKTALQNAQNNFENKKLLHQATIHAHEAADEFVNNTIITMSLLERLAQLKNINPTPQSILAAVQVARTMNGTTSK